MPRLNQWWQSTGLDSVANNQMDIWLFWHIGIDVAQELEEFLMTVPGLTMGKDVSRSNVKGCK